ncbi:DUF3750 domain-containing protein [Marinomonas sp. C2222]|uniref:DUF3750 domain-containing protein n=1 Tax=Marinomonas sargassi TaxID=2984494 RepID=A0ABT2YPN9_9GAMM|nr:DUF3750 domain-containing protein [Marinomonas sargassi]MCV2401859.1 DUF3750 domain-containing protein [Marinomonas sargassi]
MKYLYLLISSLLISACSNNDWRTASREPAGIAPDPKQENAAVIEFYAADAFSWRGWFAVHSWLAVKEKGASFYKVYEVTGWRVKRGQPALHQYQTKTPDRYWFGSKPEKILSIIGPKAEALIPEINAAVARYPWKDEYKVFPGPNSNTFPTWIGLQVPELNLDMPFSAIGSGYASKK